MSARLTFKTAPLSVLAGSAIVALYVGAQIPAIDPGFATLPASRIVYQLPGEFTKDGKPVANPVATVKLASFTVMTDLVSVGEFKRCVAARACPANREIGTHDDHPAVNVSWRDASSYAAWLSGKSGHSYRLPTDEEWSHAAGERARGELPAIDASDATEQRLKRYDQEFENEVDGATQPRGYFGRNRNGLNDIGGNVWEWTDTCYVRHTLGDNPTQVVNCGVRVVAGRHRAYVTDFIRDARSGGCSGGKPPANLGFRLVRDISWQDRLKLLLAFNS